MIRLLNEGVPTARDPAADRRRQSLGGENDGVSRQLARYVKETGENGATAMDVKLVYRRDRFGRGGDQISFLLRGWAAVRFSEPNENFDHQHQDVRVEDGRQFGDLIEFVDFDYLARVTRVIGSSLAALARAPRAPSNVRIPTALSYDTQVSWNASPESDVAGYEVVWRDSDRTGPGRNSRGSATSPPQRSRTSTRTTTRSASGRSTATATAAPSPRHEALKRRAVRNDEGRPSGRPSLARVELTSARPTRAGDRRP